MTTEPSNAAALSPVLAAASTNTRASPLLVRQATLADVDALAPLFDAYRQFYQQAPDLPSARQFLLARLSQGESVVFMACAGDVPVGFTQLYPSFSSTALAPIWILNDLYVHTEARRQGAAQALINAATGFAKAAGAAGLNLSTAVTNVSAQRLYQRMGWTRDEVFLYYDFAIKD